MTWYHLSPDDGLDRIVPSTATKTSSSITPRVPDESYGEDKTTCRVCVAPTVWQCVLSIPRTGQLYIYAIDIESVTEPTEGIADIETTDEKWITNDDIPRCTGMIGLTQLGSVDINKDLTTALNINCRTQLLPFAPNDESCVWEIRDRQWSLASQLRFR